MGLVTVGAVELRESLEHSPTLRRSKEDLLVGGSCKVLSSLYMKDFIECYCLHRFLTIVLFFFLK